MICKKMGHHIVHGSQLCTDNGCSKNMDKIFKKAKEIPYLESPIQLPITFDWVSFNNTINSHKLATPCPSPVLNI